MSNTYFQFKAFTIHQAQAGMKVSTDACFFGAFIQLTEQPLQVLDVGTGTGLLALMLAQRYPSSVITALEIDKHSFMQAVDNIQAAPFQNQISLLQEDFFTHSGTSYDVIISNPPYFHQQLTAIDPQRQTARHLQNQPIEWLKKMKQLLTPNGHIWLLLHEKDIHCWQNWQSEHLHTIAVKTHAHKSVNRYILHWDFSKRDKSYQTVTIYEAHHQLTPLAQHLLKPYYLNL